MRKHIYQPTPRKLLINFYLQEIATKCNSEANTTKKAITTIKQRICCHKIMPNTYLTQQEYRCLAHLIHGTTVKETAANLNLSPRTVEFYLNNIKQRFKLKKKRLLIELFTQQDYTFNNLID